MAENTRRVSLLSGPSLWFSILGGPVIWFAHFNLVYSIVDFGCQAGADNPATALNLAVIAVTVIAVLLIGWAGITSYRNWQRAKDTTESDFQERSQFMGFIGMLLSAIFIVATVVSVVPVFFLSTCGSITA